MTYSNERVTAFPVVQDFKSTVMLNVSCLFQEVSLWLLPSAYEWDLNSLHIHSICQKYFFWSHIILLLQITEWIWVCGISGWYEKHCKFWQIIWQNLQTFRMNVITPSTFPLLASFAHWQWKWRHYGPPNHCSASFRLHGVTTRKMGAFLHEFGLGHCTHISKEYC
jgi:hypothetical protein